MFKVIAFLKGKAGMSREEIRDYYENNHHPLARRTFPQIKEHRRNYIMPDGQFFPPGVVLPPFDVITEIWFEDRAGFDEMMRMLSDPAIAAPIRADELNFLQPEECGMMIVEES